MTDTDTQATSDPAAMLAEIEMHTQHCGLPRCETCRECAGPWPCLARRLADEVERLTAERDALAAVVGVECPIADLSIVESLRVASAHAGQYAEDMQAERDAAVSRADALMEAGNALAEALPMAQDYQCGETCGGDDDHSDGCRATSEALRAWRALRSEDGAAGEEH